MVASNPQSRFAEFAHRASSSPLSSLPSGLTTHSNADAAPLPTITEDKNIASNVEQGESRPRATGGIVINDGPHNRGSRTSSTNSSCSSRSSRITRSDNEMSEDAQRICRAGKQRHHGARIPKELDNVMMQEILITDARHRSEQAAQASSSAASPAMVENAISSLTNVIRNEFNGSLMENGLTRLESQLRESGLIEAAIQQLHAPQGAEESPDDYACRVDSLRRLQDPLRFRLDRDASCTECLRIRWASILARNCSAKLLDKRNSEILIVVPIADDRSTRIPRNQEERAARSRQLFRRAGAGNVDIRANDMNSDSTDINSDDEIARIREMLSQRNHNPTPNVSPVTGADSVQGDIDDVEVNTRLPESENSSDILGMDRESSTDMRGYDGDRISDQMTHSRHSSSIHSNGSRPEFDESLLGLAEHERLRLRDIADEIRHQNRMEQLVRDAAATEIRHRERLIEDAVEEAHHIVLERQRAEQENAIVGARSAQVLSPILVNAPAQAPVQPEEPANRVQRNPDFVARVALQRTRFNHLREAGESPIEDQGIGFNGDGNPFERECLVALEREAITMYFMRNNLDPGFAFGPGQNDIPDGNNVAAPDASGNNGGGSEPPSDGSDSGFTDTSGEWESVDHAEERPQGYIYPEDRRREHRRRRRVRQRRRRADSDRSDDELTSKAVQSSGGGSEPPDSGDDDGSLSESSSTPTERPGIDTPRQGSPVPRVRTPEQREERRAN
ncbi:hypothetical protein C8J56DRAFT_881545 [Mycena floridula]|nr:hypothetical protein C8J56DRAFT_881545 [Mycena floridula]